MIPWTCRFADERTTRPGASGARSPARTISAARQVGEVGRSMECGGQSGGLWAGWQLNVVGCAPGVRDLRVVGEGIVEDRKCRQRCRRGGGPGGVGLIRGRGGRAGAYRGVRHGAGGLAGLLRGEPAEDRQHRLAVPFTLLGHGVVCGDRRGLIEIHATGARGVRGVGRPRRRVKRTWGDFGRGGGDGCTWCPHGQRGRLVVEGNGRRPLRRGWPGWGRG